MGLEKSRLGAKGARDLMAGYMWVGSGLSVILGLPGVLGTLGLEKEAEGQAWLKKKVVVFFFFNLRGSSWIPADS